MFQAKAGTAWGEPIMPNEQAFDEVCEVCPGDLDGVTIMRYTHSYREQSVSGVGQHLRTLNRGLLQRHSMTILQTHVVPDLSKAQIETEKVGKGQILWIPISSWVSRTRFSGLPGRALYVYDQTLRLCRQNGEGMARASLNAVKALLAHRFGALRHRAVILSNHLSRLLLTHRVNLLAVHWVTYDTEALIRRAEKADIPFVLIHHFDNAMFSEPRRRRLVPRAAAIGGQTLHNLPDYVSNRFKKLLSPIDTEFFSPEKARPARPATPPMVLMPALIKRVKGHSDLLRATSILAARSFDFQICCPGAVEDESLLQDLLKYVAANGLEPRVAFLGELSQEQLRDYYALSSLVVMPSHSEGLPRVIVEAQAMKKPVVVYHSGGVADSLLPNETGFLVKIGDVEALADRIGFLLENEAERLRFGERGRRFVVRRFTVPVVVHRHEVFYLRALSGGDMLASTKNFVATSAKEDTGNAATR